MGIPENKKEIRMIFIETNTTAGAENLAFEEYYLKREDITEPILLLWRNRPTIVVGAFQNTYEEINEEFVKEHGIDVIRRASGGGAVYHDLGNLCFSFISIEEDFSNMDYRIFLQPVVEAMQQMGVAVNVSGRNDLLLNGAKISGSATRIYKNRVLFHGTILYDSDLEVLGKALRVRADKLESKGIKSVRSRVTNIRGAMGTDMEILAFKEKLLGVFAMKYQMKNYEVTEEERLDIQKLVKEKYQNFEWTYGKNPLCTMKNRRRFSGGTVTVRMTVKHAKVQEIHFEGDFLGCKDIEELESRLIGVRYEKENIEKNLENIDISLYVGSISKEELLQCVMGEE